MTEAGFRLDELSGIILDHFTVAELAEWCQCPRRAWLNRMGAQSTKRSKRKLVSIATSAARSAIQASEVVLRSHRRDGPAHRAGPPQTRFPDQPGYPHRAARQALRSQRPTRQIHGVHSKAGTGSIGCEAEFGSRVPQVSTRRTPAQDGSCHGENRRGSEPAVSKRDRCRSAAPLKGYVLDSPGPITAAPTATRSWASSTTQTGSISTTSTSIRCPSKLIVVSGPTRTPYLYLTMDYALNIATEWIEWSGEADLETLDPSRNLCRLPRTRGCARDAGSTAGGSVRNWATWNWSRAK